MLPGSREIYVYDLSGRKSTYLSRALLTDRYNLYLASPLWEQGGSVAYDYVMPPFNGAYSNVTLDSHSGFEGRSGASFNGTTSYVNLYSTSFVNGVTTPANYCLNPSFEVNVTDDWGAPTVGSKARGGTRYVYGSFALDFTAGASAGTITQVSGLTVPPGEVVTLTGRVYNTGATAANGGIALVDVTNSTVRGTATTPSTGSWQTLTITWKNNTATDVVCSARLLNSYTDSVSVVSFDGMHLEPGMPSTYSDGTINGCSWAGTAHNSISLRRLGFNGEEGTALIWGRVSGSGVWTDATARRLLTLGVDASNYVAIYKHTDNDVYCAYNAAGTLESQALSIGTPTDWFQVAVTWSKAADQFKAYLNGAQVGATGSGLGIWSGAIASTLAVVGASSTTPADVWSGLLANVCLWNRALNATQIAALYQTYYT